MNLAEKVTLQPQHQARQTTGTPPLQLTYQAFLSRLGDLYHMDSPGRLHCRLVSTQRIHLRTKFTFNRASQNI